MANFNFLILGCNFLKQYCFSKIIVLKLYNPQRFISVNKETALKFFQTLVLNDTAKARMDPFMDKFMLSKKELNSVKKSKLILV